MSFKSFNFKKTSYTKNVDESLVMWLDYNFFNDGAYYQHSNTVLSKVDHPLYSNNLVYGSNRKNWVWESGTVNVTVNNSPVSNYTIDYTDGLVIFNTPPNGTVRASYSYKAIQIINGKDNKFFRGANTGFDVYDGVFREDSLQMPSIVVEHARNRSEPSELGNYSRNIYETKHLYLYHSNADLLERISDVLINQVDTYFGVFDFDASHRSGIYPLNNGVLINVSGTYPNLVRDYQLHGLRNSNVYIMDARKEKIQDLKNDLFYSTIAYDLSSEFNMGTT